MRNPDLVKLLRDFKFENILDGEKEIFEQAAIELEKLEKIYKLNETEGDIREIRKGLIEILNDK